MTRALHPEFACVWNVGDPEAAAPAFAKATARSRHSSRESRASRGGEETRFRLLPGGPRLSSLLMATPLPCGEASCAFLLASLIAPPGRGPRRAHARWGGTDRRHSIHKRTPGLSALCNLNGRDDVPTIGGATSKLT